MDRRHRVLPSVLALIGVLWTATPAVAQDSQAQAQAHRLTGSWHILVTADLQARSFPGLIAFTRDGIVMATESPGPFESQGFGNWVVRGKEVAYTWQLLFGSQAGAGINTGRLKVVGTLQFDRQTEGWSGPFRVQVFDAAGVLLFQDTGQAELTRMEVESLD